MQDLIRKLPGVVSTRVGYIGENPASYKSHVGTTHLVSAQTTNSLTRSIRQNCENFISPGAAKTDLNPSPSERHETDWRLLLLSAMAALIFAAAPVKSGDNSIESP